MLALLMGSSGIASAAPPRIAVSSTRVVSTEKLPGGRTAIVYADGVAEIDAKNGTPLSYRALGGAFAPYRRGGPVTDVQSELAANRRPAYASDRVIVAFRPGAGPMRDTVTVAASTLAASLKKGGTPVGYTNDAEANRALSSLGADRVSRIAPGAALSIGNTYVVHVASASAQRAVKTLRNVRSIAYVGPDFAILPMNAPPITIGDAEVAAAKQGAYSRRRSMSLTSSTLPSNYAVSASAQSFLNANGVDAIAAFDEIQKAFGQLPGQGEIITNVSLGDLDDASAATTPTDPCNYYAAFFGATTHVIGGQRYLDLPSMPLIPAYTAAADGTLSGSNEVCGVDPRLSEIGLDFSVMAPLPESLQRSGELGSGFTDLLGIAPGASYRLVVPASPTAYTSDIAGAFLGAALQRPAPNVITASLGPSGDQFGFPGRFLEEDPLMQSVIRYITGTLNEVVCISSNDGTRMYTNASIGPSGGSAATDVVASAQEQTQLDDLLFSTAPSRVLDAGSIDVGGTTLDDVALGSVAETRITGWTRFSSGFGSRVNVSAPSDNIIALQHSWQGYDSVVPVLEGGTSASAPMIAAAAAVVLQVARLTGQPMAANAVRSFLEQTATPVANAPQFDRPISVGPRISVRRAVETLLGTQIASKLKPSAPRVAIAQRQAGRWNLQDQLDTIFVTNTDPTNIDMQGPNDPYAGVQSGEDALSSITIAPDWEALPSDATYALSLTGTTHVLATTPSTRLLPTQILQAAGLTAVSASSRTVHLTYQALRGGHVIAQNSFSLTFGPWNGVSELVRAPEVAPVQSGATMKVAYDLRAIPPNLLSQPTLLVSYPGRVNPVTGNLFFPSASFALTAQTGTIDVPIASLAGDGVYGVGILLNQQNYLLSDFAYTRVNTVGTARPAAPEFVTQDPVAGTTYAHNAVLPMGGSFTLAYDVSNVRLATGAIVEVSAAGPNFFNLVNPFNNPNGSIIDHNGSDSGSVYQQTVGGTKGTVTLNGPRIGLNPAMSYVVRVLPVYGTQVVGEASDVSSLTMNAVAPSSGNLANLMFDSMPFGYAIDPNGDDGFIASNAQLSDGSVLKTVQAFTPSTGALGNQLFSGSFGCSAVRLPGNGIFGADVGLVELWTEAWCTGGNAQVSYQTLTGQPWTPPAKLSTSVVAESNSISGAQSGAGAFVTKDSTPAVNDAAIQTFKSDVAANTFSKPVNIDNFSMPLFRAFDYDGLTGLGYLAIDQYAFFGVSKPTAIVQVDYKTGKTAQWYTNGCGYSKDFVLDSSSHLGILSAATTRCNGRLQIINLAAKTATSIAPPAVAQAPIPPGPSLSADPVNHLFFVQVPISADAGTNNNSLSTLDILDESGNEKAAIEKFNFFWWLTQDNYAPPMSHYFQVNGHTRKGYVLSGDLSQIVPFSY